MTGGSLAASISMIQDEIGDPRRDFGAEPRAVEDAVMADDLLQMIHFLVDGRFGVRSSAACVWPTPEMSSFSPSTAMIAHAADRREVDRLVAVHHLALRQLMLDEDLLDRLEIELGGQIHDREIFVVEIAVLLGRIAVALRRDA